MSTKSNFTPAFSIANITHLFFQPALPLRREESVHEVVVSLVRDLERFLLDIPVDGLQHINWQIFPGVDSLVLLHKLVGGDFDLSVWVVKRSVEHDDGEGEDEAGVPFLKEIGVLSAVVGGEGIHHAVYLHRLARQPEVKIEL